MVKRRRELKGIYVLHVIRHLLIQLSTIYYRRKISPQKIETVLQAHTEGSSLRGISRTSKLAYNTVISVVRYAATKAQMVHQC